MKLYKLSAGAILQHNNANYLIRDDWDTLINRDGLQQRMLEMVPELQILSEEITTAHLNKGLLPPIGRQEVWAAGVTYLRSREARMEESADSGAADLYDKVYCAERPESFFKSMPRRVAC